MNPREVLMNPERMLGGLAGEGPGVLAAAVAIAFVGLGYFAVLIDRRREDSPSKDDTQVGIKLVLYGLVLAGIGIAATGAELLLTFVLGGFEGGGAAIKISLPPILVGAATVFVVMQMLLPGPTPRRRLRPSGSRSASSASSTASRRSPA
jgi:hypothetical protein